MYTIAALYTGKGGLGEMIRQELCSLMDDVIVEEIIDSELLNRVIADNGVTKSTIRRVLRLFDSAVEAGADMILCTCSSIGAAAEVAQQIYDIPVVRVDAAMVNEAVKNYEKIAVVATLPTTLGPTTDFLKKTAREMSKTVHITEVVAEGAFSQVKQGNIIKHNELIVSAAEALEDVQAIILAQASMMSVREQIEKATGLPTLASPRMCAEQIARQRGILKH